MRQSMSTSWLMKGHVYIMSNKSFEGLLKIGMTEKDLEARRKELQGTAVPHTFELEYSVLCDDFPKIERRLTKHSLNKSKSDC